MTSAVVFAYHNVGVRCLSVLLAQGIDVRLVVTHRDAPGETIWFDSVAALATRHRVATIAPEDPTAPDVVSAIRATQPDFLFSFYYRHMLCAPILAAPARGALNMHGSLLPRYRGRVPVNWAILRGESETGATLHYMTAKPDRGAIVDQQSIPILPDDTALDVFRKVTVAAEIVLHRSLPSLVAGTAPAREQDQSQASYFGGRRPEDGRIDWRAPARSIHDLVRAVAPPYPGAFFGFGGRTVNVWRTVIDPQDGVGPARPELQANGAEVRVRCADGMTLRITELGFDGVKAVPDAIISVFGPAPHLLP